MMYPVSLVRELQSGAASGVEHKEEKKQIWKVEDAECFLLPSCNSTGPVAVVAAAALVAVENYTDGTAAASCGAFVVGMGATLVILFGTVVATESMMHFLSLDGVILCGALAPAAAAMVVVGTLVEYGHVSEPVTARVQQHAAAAMEETRNEQASLNYEYFDEQVGVCVGVSELRLAGKSVSKGGRARGPSHGKATSGGAR